jgi:hypothetical protein
MKSDTEPVFFTTSLGVGTYWHIFDPTQGHHPVDNSPELNLFAVKKVALGSNDENSHSQEDVTRDNDR